MRIVIPLIFLIFALPICAMPTKGTVAGGIILGEPTGLSAKSYVTSTQAFDAALSYSLRTDSVWIHSNYLYHSESLSKSVEGGRWVPYGGLGGLLYLSKNKEKQSSRVLIAARLPGGLMFYPTESSFEFFAELGLIVGVLPATEVSMSGGVGTRYVF
jgi:hypothetical protein